MLLPESRYRFTPQKTPRRRPKGLLILIAAAVVLVGSIILIAIKTPKDIFSFLSSPEGQEQTLQEIWEAKNYEALNQRCEELLVDKPLDFEGLVYNGFAYFYRGVGQFSLEERLPFIDQSIANLRKALILDPTPLQGKIEYILGKAYFQKGKFYSDLSLKYLEESVISGYIGEDTFEYLGLVYSGLGDYKKSAEYYLKALDTAPSDTLYLVLAQTYNQLGDIPKAEEYLIWALNKTKDHTVEEKSRFLLGHIYMDKKEYLKAEEQFTSILEENRSSADAHYYLGDVYEEMGDNAKARYQWRKALEIDPYHYGARLKLY